MLCEFVQFLYVWFGQTMDAIVSCRHLMFRVFLLLLLFFFFNFVCVSSSFLFGWQGRCLKLALMFSARAPDSLRVREESLFITHQATPDHGTQGRRSYRVTAWTLHFLSSHHGFLIWFGKCMYKNIYILYIHVVKHLY